MKLKYPKKITIGAHEFLIKYDKQNSGGSFQYPSEGEQGTIVIGTRDSNKDTGDFLSILLHEIVEVIHYELGHRFTNFDERSYIFSYKHQGHTTACSMLAGILKQFIK